LLKHFGAAFNAIILSAVIGQRVTRTVALAVVARYWRAVKLRKNSYAVGAENQRAGERSQRGHAEHSTAVRRRFQR